MGTPAQLFPTTLSATTCPGPAWAPNAPESGGLGSTCSGLMAVANSAPIPVDVPKVWRAARSSRCGSARMARGWPLCCVQGAPAHVAGLCRGVVRTGSDVRVTNLTRSAAGRHRQRHRVERRTEALRHRYEPDHQHLGVVGGAVRRVAVDPAENGRLPQAPDASPWPPARPRRLAGRRSGASRPRDGPRSAADDTHGTTRSTTSNRPATVDRSPILLPAERGSGRRHPRRSDRPCACRVPVSALDAPVRRCARSGAAGTWTPYLDGLLIIAASRYEGVVAWPARLKAVAAGLRGPLADRCCRRVDRRGRLARWPCRPDADGRPGRGAPVAATTCFGWPPPAPAVGLGPGRARRRGWCGPSATGRLDIAERSANLDPRWRRRHRSA